ncbi:hypothetical protein BSKO_02256 [Bryopsis sp. KO-2023]|nr:hypothetical protein BSKO_02256 [Bryopsis sp. KO-2023]
MVDANAPSDSITFLDDLRSFWRRRGEELKIPVFNKQEMDLEKLWGLVRSRGGSDRVCREKKWASIGRYFDPPRSMTNLSFHIKRIYDKCLLQLEKERYPSEAMSKENELPSSADRKNDIPFFGRPVHVPRKKRSSIRRSWRCVKKARLGDDETVKGPVDEEPGEQTPSWLRGCIGEAERCEAADSPGSQLATPDWLAGKEALVGNPSPPLRDLPCDADEYTAAAALSELCNTTEGTHRSSNGKNAPPVVAQGRLIQERPRFFVKGVVVLPEQKNGGRLQSQVQHYTTGQPSVSDRKIQFEDRHQTQGEQNPPRSDDNVVQVAPSRSGFLPPAPVIAPNQAPQQDVATKITELYEGKIATLRKQHLSEIAKLKKEAARDQKQLLEKQTKLRATEASAEEARRCFELLLDMVQAKEDRVVIG